MIKFFDYYIYSKDISKINLESKLIINTINPHSFVVAINDEFFKKSLKNSDILLPDGIGIVFGIKLLYNKKLKRITGYDIHEHILNLSNKNYKTVFYLGSSNKVLEKLKENVKKNFRNLKVFTYSPPFKNKLSKNDNLKIISKINKVNPDVLFVGMTAPKQEKWVYENHKKINIKTICSIGAVFDFYSKNKNRAPNIFLKLNLEWFYRIITDFRLLKRTLISAPIYIFLILRKKINLFFPYKK
tara:strand:+ start:969 stop:1697 length:729 start_codon:yes stop_codon:yes gene_type:complete